MRGHKGAETNSQFCDRFPVSKYRQDYAIFRIQGLNSPWKEVLNLGVTRTHPKGFEANDPMRDHFFLLLEGSIRLSSITSTGLERIMLIIERETIAGELKFLHKIDFQPVCLRTLEKSKLVYFHKEILSDTNFCKEHPHLILNLVRSIGIKAGILANQSSEAILISAKIQVCRILFQIWLENGKKSVFNPEVSQSELSAVLGIHRSSICRVISELRQEGIIGRFSKSEVEIRKPDALAESAEIIDILEK